MRPSPGFRLNAPQTEGDTSEFEQDPFGEIADDVECDPKSEIVKPPSVKEQPSTTSNIVKNGNGLPPHLQSDPRLVALAVSHLSNQDQESPTRLPLKCLIFGGLLVICLLVGLIVVVAVALGGGENESPEPPPSQQSRPTVPTIPPNPPTPAPAPTSATTLTPVENQPTPEPKTTLGRVYQRGFLRCGVAASQPGFAQISLETGEWEGFDVDMCRAVSAAIFGEDDKVEFIPVSAFDRFSSLKDDDFDMLSRATTHTMQREVLESGTGAGFSFSIPYLYNGLQFGGSYPFVECADNLTVAEDICKGTKICVLDGTTHVQEITAKIPDAQIVLVVGNEFLYTNFIQGFCNVIAGEQFDIAESIVRGRGYDGAYASGVKVHSKEPLCMVTRDDDPQWSDFVNWVMEALLTAEDEGITSRAATFLRPTTVFGDTFANMFSNAIQLVGNYGEIYERNLEALLPRPPPDDINKGDSGLIYAFPFGDVRAVGDGPVIGGTLDKIRQRGYLRCGISRRVIFAQFNVSSQNWNGFDVDFCKALSAAIFENVTDTVVYTDLPASARFQALQDGDVDVLSRLTTVTLSRDALEPNTGVGFAFSQPNFYDGLTFGGIPPFAQCADRLDVTSISCQDVKICVNQGTTFETRLQTMFHERFVVPQQSGELTVEGLVAGECNVIAGGVVDVSLTSIRNTGYDGPYQTGSSRYSKDPLALVTREDDVQWSKFVFWIVSAIFYADEMGITQDTASELPTIGLFGPLFFRMFQDAVGAVGNYGEIYERQAEADVPRGGLNLVNRLLSGPQHYPLPGWG